jgi:hypothetical protein
MTDGNADNDRMTTDFISAFDVKDLINSLENFTEIARPYRKTNFNLITADDLNILLEKAELVGRVKRTFSVSDAIGKDELYEMLD